MSAQCVCTNLVLVVTDLATAVLYLLTTNHFLSLLLPLWAELIQEEVPEGQIAAQHDTEQLG